MVQMVQKLSGPFYKLYSPDKYSKNSTKFICLLNIDLVQMVQNFFWPRSNIFLVIKKVIYYVNYIFFWYSNIWHTKPYNFLLHVSGP